MSDFGAELFEAFGIPVSDNPDIFTESEFDRYTKSSEGGKIPSEMLRGSNQSSNQQIAEDVISDLDSLLIEPPFTELETAFRKSLVITGLAAMAAGLIFVTFFTRQALVSRAVA